MQYTTNCRSNNHRKNSVKASELGFWNFQLNRSYRRIPSCNLNFLLYYFQDQDPGSPIFTDELRSITREILLVRYKLLPYLYTLLHQAHISGSTVVRPLLHEWVDSERHSASRRGANSQEWKVIKVQYFSFVSGFLMMRSLGH